MNRYNYIWSQSERIFGQLIVCLWILNGAMEEYFVLNPHNWPSMSRSGLLDRFSAQRDNNATNDLKIIVSGVAIIVDTIALFWSVLLQCHVKCLLIQQFRWNVHGCETTLRQRRELVVTLNCNMTLHKEKWDSWKHCQYQHWYHWE